MNGRSYMQLAKLEPGVTIASGSVAQFNALFTVSVLGAGNPSPYVDKTFSVRVDDRLSDKHALFVRYSHDGNSGFGQSLELGDPSNWGHNTNWADQSIIGITSTLKPTVVNDLRFQYNYWNNHNFQAVSSDCSAPCVAGSLPNVFTFVGSNMPAIGPNFNAPQSRNTRRFEVIESLTRQEGTHRLRFGGDLNPTKSNGLWGFCTPMCVGATRSRKASTRPSGTTPTGWPDTGSICRTTT